MISRRLNMAFFNCGLTHDPSNDKLLNALARVVDAAEKIQKMYMRAGPPKSEDAWLRYVGSQAGQIIAPALKELERVLKECGV